jgi:methyl coenzyme M reductase subunit C-like uncharacterized protein (methanogenesis marker protein 7)
MWKRIALFALVLWTISLGTLGFFFIQGNTEQLDDGRISVRLTKNEKNRILGEMRMLLSGVQMIIASAMNNDFKVVEKTASSLGMKVAIDEDPALLGKLPLDLKKIGLGVHRRFDNLASKVRLGATKDQVIREVSDIMLTCVSCHHTYRLDVRD